MPARTVAQKLRVLGLPFKGGREFNRAHELNRLITMYSAKSVAANAAAKPLVSGKLLARTFRKVAWRTRGAIVAVMEAGDIRQASQFPSLDQRPTQRSGIREKCEPPRRDRETSDTCRHARQQCSSSTSLPYRVHRRAIFHGNTARSTARALLDYALRSGSTTRSRSNCSAQWSARNHFSRRTAQTSYFGISSLGLSRVPTMISASSSRRCTTRPPHFRQKLRTVIQPGRATNSTALTVQMALKAD